MNPEFIFVNQVTGPLFIDIVNVFVRKGQSVTLYTGTIEKTYADLDERIKVRKLTPYNRNNIFKRIITWGLFFFQALYCILMDSNKKTRFFFVSNPPIGPFLGLFTRSGFDVLIYDIYPDILTTATSIKSSNWFYIIFAALNKKVYKKAESIFTISEGMKNVLSHYVRKDKIEVINCWANTDYIKPIPKYDNKFIQKFSLQDKFIVMYSGNLGLAHDIESILEAADQLKNDDSIQFVIIGEGAKKKQVVDFVRNRALNNVLILPFQDQDMLPYSMSAADISAITLDSGGSTYAVPSKTYYFLSAGAVILAVADSDSELANIVEGYNAGFVVTPRDIKSVVRVIQTCIKEDELVDKLKYNSRIASESFSIENAEKFYNSTI